MKKILDNKIINTIISTIEGIICFFLFCIVVITLFQRINGSFFGYRIYTVASASMIPNYNVGDVLLVEKRQSHGSFGILGDGIHINYHKYDIATGSAGVIEVKLEKDIANQYLLEKYNID